ncbi:hypothetical protein Q9295_12510 [Xinfangfangia sp. CPCC 101601]|uniref:Uncharacterized protein n=1 Tax=Pseudogemmobacter lacusdianii TaxID=3069608 RepID=A0ABU0VZK9_9RHOB|nr:hypothetical protein [Xinfangfangia sp. CPCC 101601]MDQ2067196.1 hypothetical protein [Xinfangfangia sp. CPCC 101601]
MDASLTRRMLLAGAGAGAVLAAPVLAEGAAWLDAVAQRLASQGGSDPGQLALDLAGNIRVELYWSTDVPGFLADIAAVKARAPLAEAGYDPATGISRIDQQLADGRSSLTDHWMDHGWTLRRITITAGDPATAASGLDEFAGFRNRGGFGGPALLTPPFSPLQD